MKEDGICVYSICEKESCFTNMCLDHTLQQMLRGPNRGSVNKCLLIEHLKHEPFVGLNIWGHVVTMSWNKEWDDAPYLFFKNIPYLQCDICKRFVKTYTTRNEYEFGINCITIDHIDGNKENNDPGNIRDLCNGCNTCKHGRDISILFSKEYQHRLDNYCSRYKFSSGSLGQQKFLESLNICNVCGLVFVIPGTKTCEKCVKKRSVYYTKKIEKKKLKKMIADPKTDLVERMACEKRYYELCGGDNP